MSGIVRLRPSSEITAEARLRFGICNDILIKPESDVVARFRGSCRHNFISYLSAGLDEGAYRKAPNSCICESRAIELHFADALLVRFMSHVELLNRKPKRSNIAFEWEQSSANAKYLPAARDRFGGAMIRSSGIPLLDSGIGYQGLLRSLGRCLQGSIFQSLLLWPATRLTFTISVASDGSDGCVYI